MIFVSVAKAPTFPSFGPFYLFKESKGRLKCQPDAAPQPKVIWSKDKSEITIPALGSPSPHYEEEQDGTLVINKVTVEDAGSYSCQATNIVGSAKASAPAYVLGKDTGFHY